jgi:hypothetical protein
VNRRRSNYLLLFFCFAIALFRIPCSCGLTEDEYEFEDEDEYNERLLGFAVLEGFADDLLYWPQSTDTFVPAGQHTFFRTDKIDTAIA